jgi:hypothetical protein
MHADTTCAVCGRPLDLWTATAALDGRTVCASGCFGAHLATLPAEDREPLAAPTVSPPLPLPAVAVAFPGPDDPLSVPCRHCHARAGQRCRTYRGHNKPTCKQRGTPPEDAELPAPCGSLFTPDLPEEQGP